MSTITIDNPQKRYVSPGNTVYFDFTNDAVIVLYDKTHKDAFVGSFTSFMDENLEGMVKDTIQMFQDTKNVEVFVAGNPINLEDSPEIKDYTVQNRNYLQAILNKYGFDESNTYIRWAPMGAESTFKFHLKDGKNDLRVILENEQTLYRGDIKQAPNPIPLNAKPE